MKMYECDTVYDGTQIISSEEIDHIDNAEMDFPILVLKSPRLMNDKGYTTNRIRLNSIPKNFTGELRK